MIQTTNVAMQDGTAGNAAVTFGYILDSGRLSITPTGRPYWSIANAQFDVTMSNGSEQQSTVSSARGMDLVRETAFEDVHGRGRQFRFEARGSGDVKLTYLIKVPDSRPFLLLRLLVRNVGSQPVRLHDLTLLRALPSNGGGVRFADERLPLDFFQVGWHGWAFTGLRHAHQRAVSTRVGRWTRSIQFNTALPSSNRPGEFWGDQWGILSDETSALVAGFVSAANQFGVLHVDCAPGQAALALTAHADGIRLDTGETLQSEWGYVEFVDLPALDPPGEYVQAVARQMQARVPVQAPGLKWTHWYHHFQNITEDKFLANLETIDRLRHVFPIDTVQLDDGYQSAWGDWEACNDKFPHGLEWLAEQIQKRGYVPGLWYAPFVVDPRSKTAQAHPDWLLKDDQGRPVSAGHIWNFDAQALDATHPEVEAHLERIADTIAHRWGFGFVKIDWCYSGALPARRHDPKATRAQALRRGLEAIRRGLGNEPFLLGCGCPFGPAIGVVDAMRIGPDTAPSWEPLIWNMPWASPFLKSERSLASLRNSIRHTLNLSTLHGRWWWNDPDVVMVRQNETRLSEDEVKSNISLVGLQGGLVVNSDDLTRLPPERVDLSALLTPILSPGARALDLLRDEMPEYYELAMERPWGRWRVVAVFNWTGAPETRTLRRAEMGLPADTRLHVFDFWNRTYWLQAASDVVLHGIPAHGCRLLRIAEDDRRPALVGDTLHVVQGGEVESFEARADGIEIHIIDLQRAAAGELWLWLPSPPVRVLCGGSPIAARRIAPDVYALPLQLQGPAKIQISL